MHKLQIMGWKNNMFKSFFAKFAVSRPIICPDDAARLGDFLYKLGQIISRCVFKVPKSNSPNSFRAFIFYGNTYQRLTFSTSTAYWRTDIRFMSVWMTRLAMLRWMNICPVRMPTISLALTRLSEQPIQRYSGVCCAASLGKKSGSEALIAAGEQVPTTDEILGAASTPVAAADSSGGASLQVSIDVNKDVRTRFKAGDAVFVYAKAAAGPKMPLPKTSRARSTQPPSVDSAPAR